jgi:SET domain-containing protein
MNPHMRRFTVRKSPVHGKGVFALRSLRAGERLVEYKGAVVPWRNAAQAYRRSGEPGHTFYFGLSNGLVIDGAQGGNSARWLNHACEANCSAIEVGDRVYIEVVRDIEPGEELFIAYDLELDGRPSDEDRQAYACHCGAQACRGSMLAVA